MNVTPRILGAQMVRILQHALVLESKISTALCWMKYKFRIPPVLVGSLVLFNDNLFGSPPCPNSCLDNSSSYILHNAWRRRHCPWHGRCQSDRGPRHNEGISHLCFCCFRRHLFWLRHRLDVGCARHALLHHSIYRSP